MVSPIVAYSGLQFTNAAECATPDTPVREQSKEAFDLVEPTDVELLGNRFVNPFQKTLELLMP